MRGRCVLGIVRAVVTLCESSITRVNVHARGALVTRRLALPQTLPDGEVELAVEGVTAIADAASARAALPDGCARSVVAVRASLTVPASGAVTGASADRVRDLEGRFHRLRDEQNHLGEMRAHLSSLTLDPGVRARALASSPRDVSPRTADALATAEMLTALVADLDARESELVVALRVVEEALEAARIDHAQARSAERVGAGHPSLRVTVHLAGEGEVQWVELTYAVPAARWWPVYTLRIRDNGRKATWLAEALVAQRSGEDWTRVKLSLSTADLLYDARLPELASLRLGKAQPPAKRAYRPPPQGLDRMFDGYDRAFARLAPPPSAVTTLMTEEVNLSRDEGGYVEEQVALLDERLAEVEADEEPPREMMKKAEMPSRLQSADTFQRARQAMPASRAAAPPAPKMVASELLMPQTSAPRKGGGVLGSLAGGIVDGLASLAPGGGGGGYGAPPEEPEELPLEPADAWLDFDSLSLKPASDRARRGRLVRESDARTAQSRAEASRAIEGVAAPPGGRDPAVTRGLFDHRYDVEGEAEVPSDAQTHRVSIGEAESAPTMRWRTTPREAAEVYREAELRNPFDAPLLAGPVDVYADGSLLTVAAVERIDRGGTMHVGMGVEQRIRVARNVRMREETAGILGGDTVAHHDVSIELTSALSQSAMVEVVDRMPVTDDKSVEVTLARSSPEHERYTQADRGAPVRGAMLWRAIVPAGAKTTIEYGYRVTLPSKNECVGGNRRD